MKQYWQPVELDQEWTLSEAEIDFVCRRMVRTRMAFALQLKHLDLEGSFPSPPRHFPRAVVTLVAN